MFRSSLDITEELFQIQFKSLHYLRLDYISSSEQIRGYVGAIYPGVDQQVLMFRVNNPIFSHPTRFVKFILVLEL